MDLKKEAQNLKKAKGNVRGEGILTDVEYVRLKKGEKGVMLVEKKMNELGCSIKFSEIKSMEWYPVWWDVLKILVIMDLFSWNEKDIFEMANFSPKISFLVKVLVKYFITIKKSFEQSPKYWRQHFDFGELEAYEFSEKEKKMVFRVKNYNIHPVMCTVFAGYFLRIAQFVVKSKKVDIEETKCVYKKDSYHEYVIRWE
ncbi:hypothetical protein AMJ47_03775 [Parcubacteria bacterium DG_72]|nr:MAG: hypothetical protein AMJ47_03775 [Parcubacteria bacterium DG_72]